jgi:hypothetical protein
MLLPNNSKYIDFRNIGNKIFVGACKTGNYEYFIKINNYFQKNKIKINIGLKNAILALCSGNREMFNVAISYFDTIPVDKREKSFKSFINYLKTIKFKKVGYDNLIKLLEISEKYPLINIEQYFKFLSMKIFDNGKCYLLTRLMDYVIKHTNLKLNLIGRYGRKLCIFDNILLPNQENENKTIKLILKYCYGRDDWLLLCYNLINCIDVLKYAFLQLNNIKCCEILLSYYYQKKSIDVIGQCKDILHYLEERNVDYNKMNNATQAEKIYHVSTIKMIEKEIELLNEYLRKMEDRNVNKKDEKKIS